MGSIFDSSGMISVAVFMECCTACNIPCDQYPSHVYVDYIHQFQVIEKWGYQYVICERQNSHGTKISILVKQHPELKPLLEKIEFIPFSIFEEE